MTHARDPCCGAAIQAPPQQVNIPARIHAAGGMGIPWHGHNNASPDGEQFMLIRKRRLASQIACAFFAGALGAIAHPASAQDAPPSSSTTAPTQKPATTHATKLEQVT